MIERINRLYPDGRTRSQCEVCYHELRKKVKNSLYNYCNKHTINYNLELVEDTFNETLAEVMQDKEGFKLSQVEAEGKNLPGYAPLLRIARKHYMRLIRGDSKNDSLNAILEEQEGKEGTAYYKPIANLYCKDYFFEFETKELLQSSLNARQYRTAQRLLKGYNQEEIASREKVSQQAISLHVKKIREVILQG